jgi:hypothetical protein
MCVQPGTTLVPVYARAVYVSVQAEMHPSITCALRVPIAAERSMGAHPSTDFQVLSREALECNPGPPTV